MKKGCAIVRAALAIVAIAASSCGSGGAGVPRTPARTTLSVGARRPSLAVVERDGDAFGALAIAVATAGIAPDRGAAVAVALGALVEARVAARSGADVRVVGGWDGWRLEALVASPSEGARVVAFVREAMLAPVAAGEPALAAVARKIEALARRPLPDAALADVARCTGEAYGAGSETAPTVEVLDAWRRAAHGLDRVAIATAGSARLADAVAGALARAPPWPRGAPLGAMSWPALDPSAVVYDASGEIAAGAVRIVVTVRTRAPERAVAAASGLGDPQGPLASRIAALEAPARIRSVVATVHGDGGCVATTLDLSPRDLGSDLPARVATAAVLARQEVLVEIADVATPPELQRTLAVRASDPRDAAERAAWWGLAGHRAAGDELQAALFVGVASASDAPEPVTAGDTSRGHSGLGALHIAGDAIRAAIDRATAAWHAPVVEAEERVERGQGEAWVLLASMCGTSSEASHDAGSGAVVATAAATRANEEAGDARVEPFVAVDGVGVLVHGPARAGESPAAHARRLGDIAARAFAADPLDPDRVSRARASLLARAGAPENRALAALAAALAPGHPSRIDPWGTTFGFASMSDEAIAVRAAAIRAGPLRVAVLANSDAAQADAVVRAVDRWVARRPGETRSCPPLSTLPVARPGTYPVELSAKGPSEALIAFPLPAGDAGARVQAIWLAAALDGPAGLLARALGGAGVRGATSGASLAEGWGAAVIGGSQNPALAVRLVAPDGSLDVAVAQARALLDRLRQGVLGEEDRARGAAAIDRAAVTARLDPRARTIGVWRGEPWAADSTGSASSAAPPLEALRAFASAVLRDESLVIVASRFGHGDIDRLPAGRESKGPSRESGQP